MHRFLTFLSLLFLLGCQSSEKVTVSQSYESERSYCQRLLQETDLNDRIKTLNLISELSNQSCHADVIHLGLQAKEKYKYKNFSILGEATSLFLPEGTFSEYVMESYERAYLSFLLAVSYFKLNQAESAEVEMRRAAEEGVAKIYNYGDDPVNLSLQAVLWQKTNSPERARSFWQRTQETTQTGDSIKPFITKSLSEIDSEKAKSKWKIYSVGSFPLIDWSMNFTPSKEGYYQIYPLQSFPEECSSESGMILSTKSWLNKIKIRYASHYHPFLNIKSWLRLPVGFVYGAGVFLTGTGVAVGGCAASSDACEGSVKIGAMIASKAPSAAEYPVKPDLRHWNQLPGAFLITTKENHEEESCFKSLPIRLKAQTQKVL